MIHEPHAGLKAVQHRLAEVLTALYQPPDCVHGFVAERSIATNAMQHVGRDWVLNVDLKDFFPSISFARIRGTLIKRHQISEKVATVIAQLCTYEHKLPQGAPTSAVISNIVAQKLDNDLVRLGRRYRCVYTRYADDLTFSRSQGLPADLASWDSAMLPLRQSRLGERLKDVIERNRFDINFDIVRLQYKDERQIVTGLVVNEKVNVKRSYTHRLRAMLYAWGKHGYASAEREHFSTFDTKDRSPHSHATYKQVVKGHLDFLGMIRGQNDLSYRTLLAEYARLEPAYTPRPIRKGRPRHLRSWRDAIWVVESDGGQGTAFELEGIGLVTCAHVVKDLGTVGYPTFANAEVFSPHNDTLRFPVSIRTFDADMDIAILDFEGAGSDPLKPKYAPDLTIGDEVVLAGYPQYSRRAPLSESTGQLLHIRNLIPYRRYIISSPIVSGASGSPVMDKSGRVVGVATKGVERFDQIARRIRSGEEADLDYGVVPLKHVHDLLTSHLSPPS